MENKKVVLLAPYSYPSACGIWARVYSDAKALRDSGYEVHIFSSNVVKGTNQVSSEYEEFEGLHLHRFKVKFRLGGTSMFWFFKKKLKEINPDIIHAHGFRHPHSLQARFYGKKLKKKVYLTSHGPFEKDPRRSIFLKLIDRIYDLLIARWELKGYNSVVMISKWEKKYLEKFSVKNLVLIPNGVNKVFFDREIQQQSDPINQVLFMGRIDPTKRPEWIEFVAERLPEVNFKIRGPIQGYSEFESSFNNLKVVEGKYTSEDFINELDKSDIFVLPSIRESFGLVIVEAMSRGKIVISSDTKGANDLIDNGSNGFIVMDEEELLEAIEYTYNNWAKLEEVRINAIKSSQQYDERLTTKKLIELYEEI